MTAALPEIVAHPQGGFTVAVPIGGASSVRIFRGWWPSRRAARLGYFRGGFYRRVAA